MDMAEVERWQEYVRIRDVEIKKLEKLLAEGMNVIPINKDVLKNPTALLNWKTKVIACFKHKEEVMTILEQNENEQAYSAGRHDAKEEAQAEIEELTATIAEYKKALDRADGEVAKVTSTAFKEWTIEERKQADAEIAELVNMLLYCNPVPAKKTQYEALMDKHRGNVMIPKILHEASRQYRHNSSDELVSGFDKDETIKIVTGLQAEIDRLMLEFCPDEMTREQLSRWGECQKPVDKHKGE